MISCGSTIRWYTVYSYLDTWTTQNFSDVTWHPKDFPSKKHGKLTVGFFWRSQVFSLRETNISPLKMDGWNTTFLLGRPIFRGELLVSGRVDSFKTCFNKRISGFQASPSLAEVPDLRWRSGPLLGNGMGPRWRAKCGRCFGHGYSSPKSLIFPLHVV